jgi:dihydroorotate dehydrogenase electron transfer subunit
LAAGGGAEGVYIILNKWHNKTMKEEKCMVVENRNINKKYYTIKLKTPYISSHSRPGNFIMLAASNTVEPLLKRPFGIFSAEPPYIYLYYEVVGKGTELISTLKPNDMIDAVGPLGNNFPPLENKKILMVAGGRGIAPIYYAFENYISVNDVFLIYGAKSKEDLNLLDEIKSVSLKKVFLYTDDGSIGKKGFVTADIQEIIKENSIDTTIACGPDLMFKSLFHTIKGIGTENYVSLESFMGCGFGICHSCVVKTITGDYKKVCTDGPVFKMEEILWEE